MAVACADDVGHPASEDVVDVDLRVGEQAVDLFGGMLGVQATGGGEALTDRADRERAAAQHAEGGIAERVDALGVKVMRPARCPSTCRTWLKENRCSRMTIVSPDSALPGGQTCRLRWSGESPRRIRKDVSSAAAR